MTLWNDLANSHSKTTPVFVSVARTNFIYLLFANLYSLNVVAENTFEDPCQSR